MASARRINYQWRVFFPLVAIIWLILTLMGSWMYHTERQLRIDNIRSQVEMVSARILAGYEDDNYDPAKFYQFILDYYIDLPLFDGIRISTYYDGRLVRYVGKPILAPEKRRFVDDNNVLKHDAETEADVEARRRRDNFYYNVSSSRDGRFTVYIMLPFHSSLIQATRASTSLIIVMSVLAAFGTALAYFMSRRLGRDIRNLRNFAERASIDPRFDPDEIRFSHDELGDTSRHIIRIYKARSAAIAKLQREHSVALHAIEEKNRLKRDLTSNINHELKTPVSVIKGYIDTINQHPEMDEQARKHFMNMAGENIDRLVTLLGELSKITRLEEGASMLKTEKINLQEIVYKIASDFEQSGVLGDMAFKYDIPPSCNVDADTSLLEMIVTNLTRNAVAYSHGTECSFNLVNRDDKFYYFTFSDNGVGVKPESLPHMFERFFREDAGRSRKRGGTGLGLAIVQSAVEALGGIISVENSKNGGLLFRFSLRRA